ncbi:helix-turn-helix domain-containing protein [Pseudomonas sp. R-28-1W-6]|uniref:AraC family transcriptional regulator n=1 Tax=Pseudomonas sp. R-28-1W-6 TaxID=2650101 RepID=UPI0013666D8F|nr:AraC family transcriptional regulator [Pseudomonas sp. R-28-1W-6]MWV11901.1 helix-turn-helix domain-containing protein [Pseudomonas sp. R-28-1W-6]
MKPIVDPRYSEASAPPQISRFLLQYVVACGHDPALLCRGLGFAPEDLKRPDYRLSFRQSYQLVRRAQQLLGDSGLGLTVGSRQTPVSWGLVGLAMLACPDLGTALQLALRYQWHIGSLLDYRMEFAGNQVLIYATPRFFDQEVAAFYLEEAFSSSLAIVRFLTGQDLVASRIEVQHPSPPHAQRYAELFRCPLRFSGAHNLMQFPIEWLELPLPTRDDYVVAETCLLLDGTIRQDQGLSDLVETIEREVRKNLGAPPSLNQLASQLNLSERTLRRRIGEAGLSYYGIVDELRRTRALQLLGQRDNRLIDVACATGFSDVRNFRRAFKRWTGVTPRTAKQRIVQEP